MLASIALPAKRREGKGIQMEESGMDKIDK